MELIIKLLTVFSLGIIELWAAVPAGFALNLPPAIIASVSATGAVVGAGTVLYLGERIRSRLMRHHDRKHADKQPGWTHHIWQRYGIIGLGLSAPLLTGAPLGVALGLTLGAPAGRLFFWICTGIILWSIILTIFCLLGLAGIDSLASVL